MKNDRKVVIGGTFDLLHKGHRELIKKGFGFGDVIIGLTSDEMAKEMKKREVEIFEERKNNLENFAKNELGKNLEVRKIEDKISFAADDEELGYIIVSPETKENASIINKKRESSNKKPLEIIKIDFVLAKDEKPISSTRIYNNEINREGELIQK